jgi:hypothetical protein
MDEKLKPFLRESPIARSVFLEGKVVLHRSEMLLRDLASAHRDWKCSPFPLRKHLCEFEVRGQVLARGKIIRRRGEYFFQVTEIPAGRSDE